MGGLAGELGKPLEVDPSVVIEVKDLTEAFGERKTVRPQLVQAAATTDETRFGQRLEQPRTRRDRNAGGDSEFADPPAGVGTNQFEETKGFGDGFRSSHP